MVVVATAEVGTVLEAYTFAAWDYFVAAVVVVATAAEVDMVMDNILAEAPVAGALAAEVQTAMCPLVVVMVLFATLKKVVVVAHTNSVVLAQTGFAAVAQIA